MYMTSMFLQVITSVTHRRREPAQVLSATVAVTVAAAARDMAEQAAKPVSPETVSTETREIRRTTAAEDLRTTTYARHELSAQEEALAPTAKQAVLAVPLCF